MCFDYSYLNVAWPIFLCWYLPFFMYSGLHSLSQGNYYENINLIDGEVEDYDAPIKEVINDFRKKNQIVYVDIFKIHFPYKSFQLLRQYDEEYWAKDTFSKSFNYYFFGVHEGKTVHRCILLPFYNKNYRKYLLFFILLDLLIICLISFLAKKIYQTHNIKAKIKDLISYKITWDPKCLPKTEFQYYLSKLKSIIEELRNNSPVKISKSFYLLSFLSNSTISNNLSIFIFIISIIRTISLLSQVGNLRKFVSNPSTIVSLIYIIVTIILFYKFLEILFEDAVLEKKYLTFNLYPGCSITNLYIELPKECDYKEIIDEINKAFKKLKDPITQCFIYE